jgi:hypothetical protein
MPPQPLSKVSKSSRLRFGTGSLETHPELAAKVLRVIHLGSMIEYEWSTILVELLKADPRIGAAMYQALAGAEARRAALEGAAKARLDAKDFDLFLAVALTTRQAARQRNAFVHHAWGDSPDIPDALLLADFSHFINLGVKAALKPRIYTAHRWPIDLRQLDRTAVQVYTRVNIEEAVSVSETAVRRIRALDVWLQSVGTDEPNARIRAQLAQLPQVEQALQRLTTQNAQSIPSETLRRKHPSIPR